ERLDMRWGRHDRIDRCRPCLQQEAHHYRVPELTAGATEMLHAIALLDEAESPVESDRGLVVGKDLQRKLVQPSSRALSIAAVSSADPTPRPRHSRATAIPSSPTPNRLDSTCNDPTTSPAATATIVPSIE